jgi:DNA-binding NtrC family response regulator
MDGTVQLTRSRYVIEQFTVRVLRGPDAPRAVCSTGIELTIGTSDGNHLRLSDPSVSRHHCVLTATPSGVELRDLESTNGTTLGGHRIKAGYLTPGASFGLGSTALSFELTGERVAEPLSQAERFGPVLGRSLEMRRLFALTERVAPSDATVLIEGETGTGKGLLAEAIHQMSPRADHPFVTVDCGSIPPNLIESELFGYERGAFTGANAARAGLFEAAQGGTVFLDEIGELPLDLQPKLLRALENRTVRRIGSQRTIALDVRIIAATNRDLRQQVNRGAFRSDLWYRLNTVRFVVPPLRERRDDIALLVAHFYRQMARDPEASPPAMLIEALMRHPLHGNVRELASAVERALIFDDTSSWDDVTSPKHETTSFEVDLSMSFANAKLRAIASWERAYIRELLASAGGNMSRAARAGRVDRSHLRALARRYDLLSSTRRAK